MKRLLKTIVALLCAAILVRLFESEFEKAVNLLNHFRKEKKDDQKTQA